MNGYEGVSKHVWPSTSTNMQVAGRGRRSLDQLASMSATGVMEYITAGFFDAVPSGDEAKSKVLHGS